MATLGYVVPEGQQSKEGFHGIRRTTEGLLYYTKVDKDNTDTIDIQGANPSDYASTVVQLPTKEDYTHEEVEFQSVEYFTGDNSTTTFDLSNSILDDTRFKVFINNIEQIPVRDFTYSSPTITFKIKPYSGAQIAVGIINKKYKNNTNDKYYQYLFESGDATYFVDNDGYLIKRENRTYNQTTAALVTDDFSTFESTSTVSTTSWQSYV